MEFSEPWVPITNADTRRELEDELRLELPRGHLLADELVEAIARREDRDHVLFALSGHRWAIVSLSWSQGRERDARWPTAELFQSAADLAVRLDADRREFE